MRPYNVEIFTPEFRYRDHTQINPADVKFYADYLDPEKNIIEVERTLKCELDDYIRIDGGSEQYFGQIKKLQEGTGSDKETIAITYHDFITFFDVDIAIDLTLIGQGDMESYIRQRIAEYFVNNQDVFQNIEGLEVSTASMTTEWNLELYPEGRDENHAVINLLDEVILRAFTKYQIMMTFSLDVQHHTIKAKIGKNTNDIRTIETDLPNVVDKYVMVQKAKKMTNKADIFNINDFSSKKTYFLHTDNTYSTVDEDRMLPVALLTDTVSTYTAAESAENIVKSLTQAKSRISSLNRKEELTDEEKETLRQSADTLNEYLDLGITINADGYACYNGAKITDVTFIETEIETYTGSAENIADGIALAAELFDAAAVKKAEDVFSKNAYENLIEVECMKDDTLINPDSMGIGQVVNVISNGMSYQTIMTGKKITENIRLIFGTIRLELTTQLKGRA